MLEKSLLEPFLERHVPDEWARELLAAAMRQLADRVEFEASGESKRGASPPRPCYDVLLNVHYALVARQSTEAAELELRERAERINRMFYESCPVTLAPPLAPAKKPRKGSR
jgi:hypothetical protein